MKRYIAFDQWGGTFRIGENPPRKWLLEYFNKQHADKIYVDIKGGTKHVGYIIAGHWLKVYRLCDFKDRSYGSE